MKLHRVSSIVAFCFLAMSLAVNAQDDKAPKAVQDGQPGKGKVPAKPKISTPVPGFQSFDAIAKQLEEWTKEAPGLAEIGTYGKSTKGLPLRYIRVTNFLDPTPKKKVLVHSCIHGGETLACSTTMATIGTMLSEYGTVKETTDLLNTRDIYFVPVLSPDTYAKGRFVDGVDPNRDYPHPGRPNHKSVTPIDAIQKFFLMHKFDAAMSGHTSGRFYWAPFADSTIPPAHVKDYDRILGEMRSMNRYGRWFLLKGAAAEFGTEVDWYYRNGAFAIGIEYGLGGGAGVKQTKDELDRTYKPFLYFLREGPLVDVRSKMEAKKSEK